MSGPKGVSYTVEQLAAMREADERRLEESRLRIAQTELEDLATECAAAEAVYGERVVLPTPVTARAGTAASLRRDIDTFVARIAQAREELAELRDRHQRARLVERLQQLGPLAIAPRLRPDQTVAAETASVEASTAPPEQVTVVEAESMAARAARYLAHLDAGIELSDDLISLVARLDGVDGERARLTARSIQEEVGRLNHQARRRARVDAELRALAIRVDALAHDALLAEVAEARRHPEAVTDDAFLELDERVRRAEESALQERNRRYAAETLLGILAAEGYEPLEGFETVVPQGGLLVRRPGWHRHGLLVEVRDAEYSLAVVRTVIDDDARLAAMEDVETETAMCADLPAILDGVEKKGVRTGRIRRQQPGDSPVRVLDGARRAEPAARRDKPKGLSR